MHGARSNRETNLGRFLQLLCTLTDARAGPFFRWETVLGKTHACCPNCSSYGRRFSRMKWMSLWISSGVSFPSFLKISLPALSKATILQPARPVIFTLDSTCENVWKSATCLAPLFSDNAQCRSPSCMAHAGVEGPLFPPQWKDPLLSPFLQRQ